MTPDDPTYAAICAQVNSSFEVRQLLKHIGWKADKVVKSGDVYLAHCPVHRDEVFRTLVLNPRNNSCHCTHVQCPANQTADFLDLLAKCSGLSLPEALLHAIEHFGADYFRLSENQVNIVREIVRRERQEPSPEPARPE